jgi:hypothetical protein
MSQRVREMIDRGHNNKTIIERLGVKPQVVYNMRYQLNKARGLGAIGKPTPKPAEGIGTPPKRKSRKVKAGELASLPRSEPLDNMSVQNKRPLPGTFEELPITMVEPKPTLWQRIKEVFLRAHHG